MFPVFLTVQAGFYAESISDAGKRQGKKKTPREGVKVDG